MYEKKNLKEKILKNSFWDITNEIREMRNENENECQIEEESEKKEGKKVFSRSRRRNPTTTSRSSNLAPK